MPRLKNRRHERFAREYIRQNFNGAAAARAVGCPHTSARTTASDWLAKPNVSARVTELADNLLDDILVSKEELIAESNKLAMFNPKDMYDEDGQLLPIHEMDDDVAISVQEMEMLGARVIKIKAGRDKRAAIEQGLKMHNAFENHQEAGSGIINIQMDEKDERA